MDAQFGIAIRGANAGGVDTRVTDLGDIRILAGDQAGIGAMTVNELYTAWSSDLKARWAGVWQAATCQVKYGGAWVAPARAYKKISGIWKRII